MFFLSFFTGLHDACAGIDTGFHLLDFSLNFQLLELTLQDRVLLFHDGYTIRERSCVNRRRRLCM